MGQGAMQRGLTYVTEGPSQRRAVLDYASRINCDLSIQARVITLRLGKSVDICHKITAMNLAAAGGGVNHLTPIAQVNTTFEPIALGSWCRVDNNAPYARVLGGQLLQSLRRKLAGPADYQVDGAQAATAGPVQHLAQLGDRSGVEEAQLKRLAAEIIELVKDPRIVVV